MGMWITITGGENLNEESMTNVLISVWPIRIEISLDTELQKP